MIAVVLVACSGQNVASPSPSPTSPAHSQAADLRTRIDLLLSEHVMIVAKESASAVNHSDDYPAYASLLSLNASDLADLVARAFGNTAGTQFAKAWNLQNGYLVDYAIGVVTHYDDKAKGASTGLTTTFTPQFSQTVSTISKVARDLVTELVATQVLEDISFIDDVFAGKFSAYYADLHRAYEHTSRLGDLLSEQIAVDFPDKFPGDSTDASVDARVKLNLDLQEHSYLATMATDATINHRDAERTIALNALNANVDALRAVVEDSRFALVWAGEITTLQEYALTADSGSRATLTGAFPTQLAEVVRVKTDLVLHHEDEVIQAVDDQRSKAAAIANDDRAAATSMQPIADSIQ